MQCFLFRTIPVLFAVFVVVNTVPSCRFELTKFTIEHIVCADIAIYVQSYASKFVEGKATYDQIVERIAIDCDNANSATCYNDITKPINGSCNEAESLQHFRNTFIAVLTFNQYMCQNNGQKYLDFIKNGGAECYLNEKKSKCYADGKNGANLGELSFKNENVCSVVDADWECLHHYDECENRNVGADYRQILTLIREKFNC